MIRIGTVSIELVEFSSKSFDCMAENHISIAVEDPFLVASEIERWAEEYIVDINLARDGRLGVVVRVNIPALLGSTLELVVLKQRIF